MREMDILKAEIERKRKQLEEKNLLAPNKKYFKRGDLVAKQREEYIKKNLVIEHKAEQQDDRLLLGFDLPVSPTEDREHKPILPRKEVIRRLREHGEPILLFGEAEYEAFQRLRKLEILEPEREKGLRNDFKAAMDKIDADFLNEVAEAAGEDGASTDKSAAVKIKDDGTTYEQIVEMGQNLGKGDDAQDSEIVLRFYKFLLKVWGEALNKQLVGEGGSVRSKLERVTHQQTVSYLKPLFRKLKYNNLQMDIMSCLIEITRHLINREYVFANDVYLQMAIGNAPWPIGVTMPGIHARTGREKIASKYVAHVLNDETQRKYIQGLKRLMTQCQKYFPTDPSKSIEYNAF